MGRFDELRNEFDGQPFQTTQIKLRDIKRIKSVMCAICVDYINYKDWDIRISKGSVTFQKKNDSHQVIKIFIDYDNELARKINVNIPEEEPIVIGLELGHFNPFVRKQIRDWLRKANENGINYYVDPVIYTNWPKTTLLPILDHYYDLLYLRNVPCEYKEDLDVACIVNSILKNELDKFDHLEGGEEQLF